MTFYLAFKHTNKEVAANLKGARADVCNLSSPMTIYIVPRNRESKRSEPLPLCVLQRLL